MERIPARVLVLDHDREVVEFLAELLREGSDPPPTLRWAPSYEAALEILRQDAVDVCLVDFRLGARTGIDFIQDREVRERGVPVILMTGRGSPDVDRKAMRAGAVDHLPKESLSGTELERSLRYAVERGRRERAESRARALLGRVQEVVSIVGADGRLHFVSPSIQRVLGLTPDELLGESLLAFVHPEDRPRVEVEWEHLLSGPGRRATLQHRVRTGEGGWRVVDTVAENLLQDRDVRGVVISSRDVTDRIGSEDRLRFQARLLDAVGQAVAASDGQGRISYVNPAAAALFGWAPEDVLGREVVPLWLAPEEHAVTPERVAKAMDVGTWTGEVEARRRDGSPFPALLWLSVIPGGAGEVRGLIWVFSDVSALRSTEAALRERVKELRLLSQATELLNRQEEPLELRLARFVEFLPSGWLHPEATEARLILGDRSYQTPAFQETPWNRSVEVVAHDERGRLDVVVTREPLPGEAPFLPEEDELLENLARILSDAVGRDSLRRLSTEVFASIQEAVLIVDGSRGGRGVRYVNRAAERMFGWSAAELVGGDTRVLHVDDEAFLRFGEESRTALDAQGVFHGAFPLRRKDGTVFQAEQTVTYLRPELGHVGGAVSVVRDVSERKEAEERLRRSEERFRQIAEHIEDVFWVTSPVKEVMEYLSPAYERIWGRGREAAYSDPARWIETVHPADRERVAAAVARQALAPYQEEYRILRPDGEERWILDRAFPVRNADGEVERIIGVARDITEPKRAEARFGALIQEIGDVIYVLDPSGVVLTTSPSVHTVTGYLPAEFVGRNALDLVHPEDRDAVRETLDEAVAAPGDTVRVEHRIRTKAGEVRHIESVARSLLGDPAVGGVLVTSRDVTQRVSLERQVRQMQKMESVGRLAGGIAHDFNNILTVIRSQTDLLLMESEAGSMAEELSLIQGAADRAANLTGQLLAFSRDQVLQPRRVDLREVVRSSGRLLERIIGADVRIVHRLEEEVPLVRLDPGQLEQVLLNLAVNARDAMPQGGTLTLAVAQEEVGDAMAHALPGLSPGAHVTLSVADTGSGMTEEVRQRVFEPFFTTKEKGKGTGLGLAMVYGTVKQSGGSIHVESSPGRGSIFRLRFPVTEVPSEAHGPDPLPSVSPLEAAHPGRGRSPGPPGGGTARILVVEDDPAVRRAVVRVLARFGIQVTEAQDADSALAALEGGGSFDLVLTDLVLPGADGLRLVERIRELRPGIRLIVMSGYAHGTIGSGSSLPPDLPFLQKPFSPSTLLARVRAELARG
jgi:two-component system, cell cycle sensor histidine kinase and response regulator CckA